MAVAKTNNHHQKECNCCCKNAYGVAESMEEMDFNRSLWGACVRGDLEQIGRLISKGVDVNAEDSSGYTPLHYAARNGHVQACLILLKNGALANKKTRSGQATSLHRAAYAGHEEVVKVLIDAGADPYAQDFYGSTSLHKAVDQGHQRIISTLINVNTKVAEIRDNKCPPVTAPVPSILPAAPDLAQTASPAYNVCLGPFKMRWKADSELFCMQLV
ncbi:hypothetical protein KI387_015167 [Taxus chinensis]|uniref:Ankyrin repeat domain-containing protein 39 n=1 Tax=Taxus chinensis TaxID=29808 RepID=A0AA38GEW5_TAXCH|nr:hypothetical protein KI387_015167 [Taxus chinensis]